MSKIVIIDDVNGLSFYKSWKDVKQSTIFKQEEFTEANGDFYLITDGRSMEISKDVKLLERVASERVFAKSKMGISDFLTFGILALTLMTWLGLKDIPQDVVNFVNTSKTEQTTTPAAVPQQTTPEVQSHETHTTE